jgi:hypothetical protein
MQLKDIRNRINRKIDEKYKTRQKILTRIKNYLNIDFNKIAIYRKEINVKFPNDSRHTIKKENDKENTFFKIEMPGSIISNARFYYKGIDIDLLSIEEAKNLEQDLEYILKEIEKITDEIVI